MRILGYDVARALAIGGMVVVNFKVAAGAGDGDPGWLRTITGLLDGRAAATFVVLAGVGAALMSSRARGDGDIAALASVRTTMLRRALFLLVVGYAFIPVWPADILHYYAFYIAIGAVVISWPARWLWMVAVGAAVAFVALYSWFGYWAELDPIALEYRTFWSPSGLGRNLLFNGWHPVIPWIGFYVAGIWLGRLDLTDSVVRRRVLIGSIGVAVAAEVVAAVSGSGTYSIAIVADRLVVDAGMDALLSGEPLPPGPIYLLAAGGTAVAVIAACVGWAAQRRDSRMVAWLVPAGQLALTLYFAHVLVGMAVLEELGWLASAQWAVTVGDAAPSAVAAGAVSLGTITIAALAFMVGGVVAAYVIRQRWARGPAEWLMRRTAG